MKQEIKNRWSGEVIWSCEADSMELAIMAAIKAGASLTGANLAGANLARANLAPIRDDFFNVLDSRPNEVDGLELALQESRVDGTAYEGECACLVGTIANVAKCHYLSMPELRPNDGRAAERWFLAINPTLSVTHPVVAITLGWISEWKANRPAAIAAK